MRKILILGAQGMLGQMLVKEFQKDKNYEVIGWDKKECDITNELEVKEKIYELKPEILINCAAYNNVDKAEVEDKELAMKVNGLAVGYLAQVALKMKILFVHYSTDYVFKGDKKEGYKEEDAPEPQSWYGKTKYEGERRVLEARINNPDFQFYLIRTSRLFGPAGIGEESKKSFVDKMLELFSQGKSEFDIVKEEVSSPTYVFDLARATKELIETKKPVGIYHRTNAGACSWDEWAKEIFRLKGFRVKINPVDASFFSRPAPRPKYSILLTTKLLPLRSWQDALAEYLKTLS
jgi:dTDP-4-dehydrorhamnose reductase